MKIKVILISNPEIAQELDVISFENNIINEQAGKGKTYTYVDPNEFKIEIIEE